MEEYNISESFWNESRRFSQDLGKRKLRVNVTHVPGISILL
jgi:hypothetical protein